MKTPRPMSAIAITTIASDRFPVAGAIVGAMRVSGSRRFHDQIAQWKLQKLEVEYVPEEWLEGKMGTAERYEPGEEETAGESSRIDGIVYGGNNHDHA